MHCCVLGVSIDVLVSSRAAPSIMLRDIGTAPASASCCFLQLDLASSLLEEHLAAAATGLAAAAADPATAAAWLERRQAVRSLAWRLEGAISGLRTCFADHEADGDQTAATTKSGVCTDCSVAIMIITHVKRVLRDASMCTMLHVSFFPLTPREASSGCDTPKARMDI